MASSAATRREARPRVTLPALCRATRHLCYSFRADALMADEAVRAPSP